MNGEVVRSGNLSPADSNFKQELMDAQNTPPSIYFIQLGTTIGAECFKVLID